MHSTLGNLPGFDFQVNPLLLLQVLDHRKQVARLGITFWPEHRQEQEGIHLEVKARKVA